jgi:hypothetical protein
MPAPDRLDPAVERDLAALDAALAGRSADAGLTALVDAVRDARPEPDPRFTARLDHRAAAGFPHGRDARRPRRAWFLTGAPLAVAASVLLALVVATAVLTGDDGSELPVGGRATSEGAGGAMATDASGGTEAAPSAVRQAEEGGGGSLADESGGDAAAGRPSADAPDTAVDSIAPIPPSGSGGAGDDEEARKVERAASLTLVAPTADVPDVADRIVRVADGAGGFVQSSSVDAHEDGANGSFELRVPVERLGSTLAALSRLAHVRDRSQTAQDITAEAVSVRERLTDARVERRALSRRLAVARTPRETIALRDRLAAVRREIAGLRAAARRIDNRAAFATVSVALMGDDEAAGGGGGARWTPGDALRDAGRVLEVAAGVALVALAVSLPLLLLAVPAAVLARHLARARRERALDAL